MWLSPYFVCFNTQSMAFWILKVICLGAFGYQKSLIFLRVKITFLLSISPVFLGGQTMCQLRNQLLAHDLLQRNSHCFSWTNPPHRSHPTFSGMEFRMRFSSSSTEVQACQPPAGESMNYYKYLYELRTIFVT